MGDLGPNAGYMVAAYVITAVVYLGYFVRLTRRWRRDGDDEGREASD